MKTAEDVRRDLLWIGQSDPEIRRAMGNVRNTFRAKGLPYHELVRSKAFGTLKYLVMEMWDNERTLLITDMDTNATYKFVDPARKEKPSTTQKIQEWITK